MAIPSCEVAQSNAATHDKRDCDPSRPRLFQPHAVFRIEQMDGREVGR